MPATKPGYLSASKIEGIAKELLQRHGLYRAPINPIEVAEAEGVSVFQATLDRNLSGILRKENGGFQIYVNETNSIRRKRYTIAHELGHFVLHREYVETFIDPDLNLYRNDDRDSYSEGDEKTREIQANMFAASLLMPEDFVRAELAKSRDVDKLAEYFGVSEDAMGYRIHNLRLD